MRGSDSCVSGNVFWSKQINDRPLQSKTCILFANL